MPEIHVVVGVAGAGKTRKGMQIVEERLKNGLRWDRIGFCSFSRAACAEAARRASYVTGVDGERLQKEGFFRTLHSAAFKCLALDKGSVLDYESRSGREFITNTCGAPRGGDAGTLGDRINAALSFWDTARARLSRLRSNDDELICTDDPSDIGLSQVSQARYGKSRGEPAEGGALTPSANRSDLPVENISSFVYREFENFSSLKNIRTGTGDYTPFLPYSNSAPIALPSERHPSMANPGYFHTCAGYAGYFYPDYQNVNSKVGEIDKFGDIIRKYEDAKQAEGLLDFTDILFKYAGFEVDDDLMFRKTHTQGVVPDLDLLLVDEYQDCSLLLDCVAQRLSRCAGELWMLGDRYQAVYAFSGSDHRVFAFYEENAKTQGKRTLLNESFRNPNCVIEWGEQVLREDSGYEERKPFSEKQQGSVGMMEQADFINCLTQLAQTDTMILARTWFALKRVQDRLNSLAIPWASCQDQRNSPWDAPVKIALTLTFHDLIAGKLISEQDFRRLTENLPMKADELQLFNRGEKSRWKKLECSNEPSKSLYQLHEWGAAHDFQSFVLNEKWRKDQLLLISIAIEKFGVDLVRNPGIKIGSCHSVKGLQATNVFALSTSSELASQSSFWEDLFLKYVTITRAALNYRVVVDLVDHARGRKLFLPCPKGFWNFTKGLPNDLGEKHPVTNPQMDEISTHGLGDQVPARDSWDDWVPRHHRVCQRDLPGTRSQTTGTTPNTNTTPTAQTHLDEWWNL